MQGYNTSGARVTPPRTPHTFNLHKFAHSTVETLCADTMKDLWTHTCTEICALLHVAQTMPRRCPLSTSSTEYEYYAGGCACTAYRTAYASLYQRTNVEFLPLLVALPRSYETFSSMISAIVPKLDGT